VDGVSEDEDAAQESGCDAEDGAAEDEEETEFLPAGQVGAFEDRDGDDDEVEVCEDVEGHGDEEVKFRDAWFAKVCGLSQLPYGQERWKLGYWTLTAGSWADLPESRHGLTGEEDDAEHGEVGHCQQDIPNPDAHRISFQTILTSTVRNMGVLHSQERHELTVNRE
jgi:hypothetical protein